MLRPEGPTVQGMPVHELAIKPSSATMGGSVPHREPVTFRLEPEVQYIEQPLYEPNRRPRRSRLKMAKKVFEKYGMDEVTDNMLQEASQLFSENYGVWGPKAAGVMGSFAKEGHQVKMGKDRLRAQYLPKDAVSSYVRVIVDGHLAGNAFACRWKYNNRSVCWITQLVVHRDYRERGLAVGLLNEFKDNDDIYGVVSSHPAACIAAARVFKSTFDNVQLDFMKEHAKGIMDSSPITYVRDAKLHGSLFNPADSDGSVSCVDTNFFVDHSEPLEALSAVKETMNWPLGELLDGHEFLLLVEVRRRARSTSRPNSAS